MADRNLVHYEESRNEYGPYWTLDIERSAAGRPGIMLTIKTRAYDDERYPNLRNQMTIVVEDGNRVLAPVLEWLNG